MKHPIQRTKIDPDGVLRFVQNDVVRLMVDLLKDQGINLNELHKAGLEISKDDWDQFNQLIGYSVHGAPISDMIVNAACLQHENGLTIEQARAEQAEKQLKDVRKLLREGVAELYNKHPSDLEEYDDED